MAEFRATVTVTLKPEILDPAGEATSQVLTHLGYPVNELRIGRHISLVVEADDREAAHRLCQQMAGELLANPIMENYCVQVEELS